MFRCCLWSTASSGFPWRRRKPPSLSRNPRPTYPYSSTLGKVSNHRRIQDFVRGGGGKALLAPGGGGARPSWPAPHYLGEQYFVGRRGGKAPLAPPPGSAHANIHLIVNVSSILTICDFLEVSIILTDSTFLDVTTTEYMKNCYSFTLNLYSG